MDRWPNFLSDGRILASACLALCCGLCGCEPESLGFTEVKRIHEVVTPGEWNFLLNPIHPRFFAIQIGEARRFQPDPRLWS